MQFPMSQDDPDCGQESNPGSSFLAHLLDALPVSISYLDRDLVYRYCNTAAARLIGRPVEQIVGHHLHEVVPDNSAVWNAMERMLRTGEPFEETISFAWADRPDLGERHYRVTYQPYLDEAGQIAGVLSRGEDITDPIRTNEELSVEIAERQRAEAVVKTERDRLQSVLELLPAYVVLLSPDHHVPFANRFFRERFGESHGQRCFEYLFGRSEPCEICESYKVLETRSSHHWEWTGPDGRNYDIFDFPFADADGSPLILEMGIDITERKETEEALQKAHDLLEARVQERTVELTGANEILQEQAEELQRQREELEVQTEELHQQTDELLISGQELRETRDYLNNLLTYANAPIIVWDPDFRITRFNEAFERLTGHKSEDVLGQPLELLFPADRKEEAMGHIQRATTGEHWEVVEIPIQRVDGMVRTVLWNSATLYAADGTTAAATIAQGQDITERKQAEQELRETRDYLDNLLTYANAPIIVWDPDFRITRFNGAFERLTGYKSEDVLRQPLDLLFPEDRKAEALEHIRRALAGEHWEVVEIPIQRMDGIVRTVLWNSATLYAVDGTTVVATIAQGQDITERKQAEQEQTRLLAETQYQAAVLEATMASLTDAVIIQDRYGKIIRMNTVAEQVLGYADQDLSRPVQERAPLVKPRFPEEDRELRLEELPSWRAMQGETVDGVLLTIQPRATDRLIPYLVSAAPIRMPDGKSIGSISTMRNVSQLRTIQEQLREANQILQRQNEELQSQADELQVQAEELEVQTEELRQQADDLQASEQALRETRDYLDNLLTYANAPIIVWDPDFRITRFNGAFERLTGRKSEEVLGWPLDLLFPEDRREEATQHIRRATTGERWEVVEIPIQRVDGTVRTVLWNSATLYAADGTTVVATIAQGQDITERKQAEQELRETRDYLDNLLTYANAPIIVWDSDFRITRFNGAFERLTGHWSEEVLSRSLDLLFPADRKEEAMEQIRRTTAGERWEAVEIPIQRVDGTVRTVLWNSATLYAADRTTVVATIAQGQDITERKQAERELRETRDYLDNLLTYANAPIIVWDSNFRITRFNGAFERLTGRKSKEVLGQPLDLLFPKERREGAMAHIRRALAGERWEVVEIPIQRVDGMVRTVLWNSATLYASDGTTVVATIAQGQDITERKQAEQELRETRDYLDNLLTYANAPIIVWDSTFRITRFNGAFEWLTGRRSEEALGQPLDLLFPANRKKEAMEHIRRTVTGERWEVVEIPIQRVDGTMRTVLWNSATLYAADGTTVVATIAQGQDITERKQAEEERERLLLQVERERERVEKLAAEAEQRANELDAVFSALTEGVVVFDGEGRVVRANPAEVAMMGGSSFPADRQGEVEQFLCRRKKDGPVISAAELPSSRALTGETVISEHMVLTTADRRDLTILSSAAPLQWGDRIVGAVATHYDVTELEQARALSELLNRVNAQIISSPDIETAIQQAIGEIVEVLGMEAGGFIRREDDHWVLQHAEGVPNDLPNHPFIDEEPDVITWITEHQDVLVIDDLALVPQFTLPIAHSYGFRSLIIVPLWLKDQLIGALMLGRRSIPVHFTHDQVDFTRKLSRLLSLALENAHLYKLARQDAETKAVLLREVNHRVKNNLSAIVGLLYGQMDRPGASAQPEYQAALRELTDRIQGLSVVHGMLSQSQWAPLRLDELAERIIGITLQSVPGGQVSVTISPSPVYISPDQAHTLALVLNELALNVGKHALQGRSCQVILNAVQEESHVLLTVRDDGPGYPAEILAKHRSGIGLELLRNLVTRNLRGQLSLRNETGAVTEIRFPLAETKGTDRS